MKRITICFFILLLIQGSCQKQPVCLCGVEEPRTNLFWLKDQLDKMLCVEVYSLFFKEIEYVIISDCPGADAQAVFYDCDGNKICEYGGINAGGGFCDMPIGFTFEFYFTNRKLIFSQSLPKP